MIGLILGTSEGKRILSLLNEYTEDIFISTATGYGGELLKDYKYVVLNNKPLDFHQLKRAFVENKVKILVDASHPYAEEITKNARSACEELSIEYIRYERPSVIEKYEKEEQIIQVDSYEKLKEELSTIEGCILNTTGSRNIDKIKGLNLNNRIIHRVLPSKKVMDEIISQGINIEDIIAIKGPISYQLNCAFIKEYDAKAIILKDSGKQGGTEEKLLAALDLGIQAFVINRKKSEDKNVYSDEKNLVEYIKSKME